MSGVMPLPPAIMSSFAGTGSGRTKSPKAWLSSTMSPTATRSCRYPDTRPPG